MWGGENVGKRKIDAKQKVKRRYWREGESGDDHGKRSTRDMKRRKESPSQASNYVILNDGTHKSTERLRLSTE